MICVPCGPPSFMILVAALVPVSCFFVVNLLLLVYMIVFTFIGWFSLLDRGIRCLNNRSPWTPQRKKLTKRSLSDVLLVCMVVDVVL